MAVQPPPRVLNAAVSAKLRRTRTGVLLGAGFEVEETAGFANIFDAIARFLPDLILVENARDGAGIAVCQQIKDNSATAAIPVICISEKGVDPRMAARAPGAEAHFVEPLSRENLVAAVHSLLRFRSSQRLSESLNRINAAISSTLDFDEIMRRVVVEAAREMGTESAGIVLLENSEWVIKYTSNLPQVVGMRFPDTPEWPETIAAQARGGKPFVVHGNALLPPGLREVMDRSSIGTKLFVPLGVKGRLAGLLAFHHHSLREFEPAQVDFAGKLGAAVSLALDNARLYGEAEEGRRLLEVLLRHAPHGIGIADTAGTLRVMSRNGQQMTGFVSGDPHNRCEIALSNWRLFRPDSSTPVETSELPLARAIRANAPVTGEEWLLETARGDRIPVLIDVEPVRDAGGAITGAVLVWQDLSARKRLENELLNARKMEATALLAGGLAHEFNNMLTVITGHCQLLIERSADARVREHLTPVLNAANRLASLTSELLSFAGRQIIRPAPVCLNTLIERMKEPLQRLLGGAFFLRTELDPDLGDVHADSGQMEHVILTLALRARDSMPEGGVIEISTRNFAVSKDEPGFCQMPPGDYVLLSIADTGPGIDPVTAERLFEPFFGTKQIGESAGLALSSVYGAVKQNRGGIRVSNAPGGGARFDICLPRLGRRNVAAG
ncbi:MAG: ATP-binding protein [Rhodospirillales bacterium]